jgi:molecular chaperone HtpG
MNAPDGIANISIMNVGHPLKPVTDEIVIGKDILELLTGAMYSDPLTVYREYVQNAADAIESGVHGELLPTMAHGKVEIWLDHATRSIRIRDNGIGVPSNDFTRRLTSIGMSQKRGRGQRGFRGVGRLSGLGYCQELVFRSRSAEDTKPRELVWNGRRLKELLRDSRYSKSLGDAVKEVATVRTISPEGHPNRFFEVEMRGVVRLKNDLLMNEDVVRSYLAQVAPVEFAPDFPMGEEINEFLAKHNVGQSISIELRDGGGKILRPHSPKMRMSSTVASTANGIETFELEGMDGEVAAVGWLLHHDYVGAFARSSLLGGLRVRAGNIQVGNDDLLEQVFSETRFNLWSIGEIHILSPKIVPNGRRDDFEANAHWHGLLGKLRSIGGALAKQCRAHSQARLAGRRSLQLFAHAQQALTVAKTYAKLEFANDFMMADIEETLDELRKLAKRQEEGSAIRKSIEELIAKLASPVSALRRSNAKSSALAFLPKNQRSTFKNALELVLTLSPDPTQASELVERVISHARKSYA